LFDSSSTRAWAAGQLQAVNFRTLARISLWIVCESARAIRWLSPENGEAEQEQIKAAHQDAEEYPQTWMGECPKSKRASKSSTINHGSTAKKKKPS
jgi:hypothetical protein